MISELDFVFPFLPEFFCFEEICITFVPDKKMKPVQQLHHHVHAYSQVRWK